MNQSVKTAFQLVIFTVPIILMILFLKLYADATRMSNKQAAQISALTDSIISARAKRDIFKQEADSLRYITSSLIDALHSQDDRCLSVAAILSTLDKIDRTNDIIMRNGNRLLRQYSHDTGYYLIPLGIGGEPHMPDTSFKEFFDSVLKAPTPVDSPKIY